MLLLVRDREPIFNEHDARAHQHLFELGNRAQELLVLLARAEAHNVLYTSTIIPAAIEEDDLASSRQVRNVALEIPLRTLALIGCRQRRNPANARVQTLRYPFDRTSLAGRISAIEDHHQLEFLVDHPILELHQLALQAEQLLEVDRPVDTLWLRAVREFGNQPIKAVII